ncbi:hypothetical protein [Thermococcus gorgonarius]|uniref:Uncharacterized protein n=1 Tax=Thermococcus gorgonarius TaxID=71997 RepID=A0A2Z2M7D4_THEGO|nr:hypothetical protein [Thermococcus gorgonarius]ASJ00212.1 hypothetical protein A3K92_01305 [Thermococcus gorgonarius]
MTGAKDVKIKRSWKIVREASRYSLSGNFWEEVKRASLKEKEIKNALVLLEEAGEIRIKRAKDGRKLYVLTLRDIRRNPVKLDRWLTKG